MSRTIPADADLMCEAIASGKLLLDVTTYGMAPPPFNICAAKAHLPMPSPRSHPARSQSAQDGWPPGAGDVKADAELRGIPVVVLTSSTAERDIVQSYDLGANCYVIKPVDLKAFQSIVKDVENFWFTVVKLPAIAGGAK